MAARYIVPALAIVGSAAAQSSCSVSGTTTIQSQGDATALAACQTFTGSIAIASTAVNQIALDGIQRISGSLIANNVTQVTALSGSSLTQIDDSFMLNGLTILTSLNFPRLEAVDTIDWEALPALQGLSFTTGVQQASQVSIQNTQLQSLSGINLQIVQQMTIANNPYLNEINMQLGNISQSLILEANGRNVSATFPNLEWAFNMTFRNVSQVSIPSLASINGSMGFYANFFSSLAAPNLTSIGQTLSFVSNEALTNLSFPELTTVGGGLQVANNTDLQTINGFSALKTVGGALDFNGNFTEVDLPAISDIRGAFNLQSAGDISNACNHFKPLSGSNNVIKGTYTCSGGESHPGGTGTLSPGTNTGSSSSSSSSAKSSANSLYISGTTGLIGVVAAIFGML
ncbi:cell wall protein Ecm33 [Recurvomyces mirabilis]|uniref:Cell wall protein Ecm33 n=1 Tax=Recurvomyces mirabilis TaxID=574656 RepID=A0AAE1C016_9PEZI|nr:cell wall protein Ecm33 [Recurvomyces mirabilis]KAK5152173.1 cell wall protein Ecm33 [Recurvomyces mirabilis]